MSENQPTAAADHEVGDVSAQMGDRAVVHYTTRTPDGGILETTRNREPLQFVVGGDEVVEGFSEVVRGMGPGDRRTVTLPPEKVFGPSRAEDRIRVSSEILPNWADAEMQAVATLPAGAIDVWVASRSPEGAILDANHPLAGRTLVYEVEVLDVQRTENSVDDTQDEEENTMTLKLTPESYLNGVRHSGLVEADRLDGLLSRFRAEGIDTNDATALSEALVRAGVLTTWQAAKLAQGKHKGFTLGGYRLQSLLGRGEMSAVYLAEHVRMKRRCAIKVLPAHRVRNTSYLERFHREAQAVAALDHPNIVRAYDVDQVEEGGVEIHFLVMEYVDGGSLEKLVERRGPLPVVEAVEYARQAAAGLGHAHRAGLVHRDVKPANLLVDVNGTVRLLDLGLARFFREEETESLTIKHDEKVLGSADYLSPEQAIDSHDVDTRADVYSLGCTLYFALTGRPPFVEDTLVQRLLAHQTKKPTPIGELRSDVPESLAALLDEFMAKSRDDRPEDAAEAARKLGIWLTEHAGDAWRRANAAVVVELVGTDGFEIVTQQEPPSSEGSKPSREERPRRPRPVRRRSASGGEPRPRRRRPEVASAGRSVRRAPVHRPTTSENLPVNVGIEETVGASTDARTPLWQKIVVVALTLAVLALGIHTVVDRLTADADGRVAAEGVD